jgi:hypothetical protein
MKNVDGAMRLLVVAAMVFTASCGGGGQGSYQPRVSSENAAMSAPAAVDDQSEAAIPDDTAPAPYDAATDGAPDPALNTIDIRAQARRVKPESAVVSGGLYAAGITFEQPGAFRYTSMFVIHQVHPNAQIPFPPSSNGFQAQLIAPWSSAGCIAVGTDFMQTGPMTSKSELVTGDNCNLGNLLTETPIDDSFTDHYVRRLAGVPSYVVQVHTTAVNPGLGSVWSALIFNFTTHRWNLLTKEPAIIVLPSDGWSEFFPLLGSGPCPKTPTFSATAFSLYDTTEHRWELVRPGLPGLAPSIVDQGPAGSCFFDISTNGYEYNLERDVPDFYWQVDSVKV